MPSKTKFKSDAFEAIHSAAEGLHRAGTIGKATMREFDESCLASPPAIAPKEIKRIREDAHVSQPVFARYLNTSESTVQKWEAGTKRPSGIALKLLAVVEKHGLKVLT
jgi:putative transcriptional regulator